MHAPTTLPTTTTAPHPLSASVLLLDNHGRVLLVKRKRGPGVCMPGGKVESGEDIRMAAVRETLEETGLQLDPDSLRVIYRAPCVSEEGVRYDTTTLLAEQWTGQLGGEEPELAPHWGRWSDLVENSPFGEYNRNMARDGFISHLGKRTWWTPQLDRWMAALSEDIDLR